MRKKIKYVLTVLFVIAISFTMSGSALAWNNVKYDKVESEIYNGCYYDMGERWGLKYLDHITININANGGQNFAYSKLVATKYCTYGYLPEEITGIELGKSPGTGYPYYVESNGVGVLGVVRDGYCLKGWSLDAAGKQMITKDDWVPTDVTELTIYAQWEKCDDAYHDWSGKLGNKYTGTPLANSTQDGKDNTTNSSEEDDTVKVKSISIVIEDDTETVVDTLTMDKTYNFYYYVKPNNATKKDVEIKVKNPSYVTINKEKGTIAPKKAGIGKSTTITVTAKDGSGKTATKQISIKDNKNGTNAAKKKATISKVTNVKGKKIKVTIKKASGYKHQIQVCTSKKFEKGTVTTVDAKNGTSKTIKKHLDKKLKKKTYYVRVRTYKKVKYKNGQSRTVYGKWSTVKKVKVKK